MQVSKFLTAFALALGLFPAAADVAVSRAPVSRSIASDDPEIPAAIPGRGATYDLGTLKSVGLETLDTCTLPYKPDATTTDGHSIKMLGAAEVYMGPSNGQSILGHAAERFVYCRDQQLYDVVYEYSKPDPLMMTVDKATFEREFSVSLSDDEVRNIKNSLYVTLTYRPANYYLMEQMKVSRSIYEAWLDLDGEGMYGLLVANARRYREQARRIRAHEPLPEYKIFKANCATNVKDDMAIVNPSFVARKNPLRLTPGAIYHGVVRRGVKKIIAYPSQRLLRLLRMKEQGKSRLFEGFVPLSKSLKHTFQGSWVLLYDDGTSPWRRFVVTPVYGAVNLAAGAVETVYGIATLPVDLFKRAFGIRKRQRQREIERRMKEQRITEAEARAQGFAPDKVGLGRIGRGLGDMMKSFSEVLTLKMRYPVTTTWTDEEKEFLAGIAQNSAILEFMKTEWQTAPLVVQGDATDAIVDPTPDEPKAEASDELLAPSISNLE